MIDLDFHRARLDRAALLSGLLDRIPAIRIEALDETRAAHRKGVANAQARIAKEDPLVRITSNPQGVAIHMMNLRATSTSGFEGACRNWIAAARKKAAEAGCDV